MRPCFDRVRIPIASTIFIRHPGSTWESHSIRIMGELTVADEIATDVFDDGENPGNPIPPCMAPEYSGASLPADALPIFLRSHQFIHKSQQLRRLLVPEAVDAVREFFLQSRNVFANDRSAARHGDELAVAIVALDVIEVIDA